MKDWGDLYFQSSNAFIDHRLFERFDASLPEFRRGEGADAGANMGAVDVERLFAPIEVTSLADVGRVLDQLNNTRMFRSEESRVVNACGSTCRFRRSACHEHKKRKQ